MNGPFLARMAGELEAKLAGKNLRYALRRASPAGTAGLAGPVYLLRMEPPAGTLVVSLRRDLPSLLLLAEGEAPAGEKDAGAARLGALLADRPVRSVRTAGTDRVLLIDWEGGFSLRLHLVPPRPALAVSQDSSIKLILPETPGPRGDSAARPRAGEERPDIAGFDPETIPEGLASEEEARAFLRGAVRALPPEWAAEVLARARFGETPAPERRGMLSAAWRELAAEFASSERAYLYRTEKRSVLSPVRLRSLPDPPREFAGFIEAAALWWRESDEAARRSDALSAVRSAAAKERKRLVRLLEKLRAELEDASRAPLYRKRAEILGIHFRDVAKGAASVRLPDPYEGGEIEIPLDPAISARRNIERLFQLAKRGERGAAIVGERIAETERLLASAEATLDAAEHATTAEEAELLAEKAAPALRKKDSRPAWREKIRKPKDRDEKVRPREYRVAGGYTVLVGRDNKENDRLTLHIARPGDIWFHAGQAAGSHVVLLRDDPRKPVPGEALLEAAAIAAWYSKAKHGSKVPVVYTERRHVRKPRGWPPGKVTCAREKTLFVDPRVPDGGAE